MLYYFKGLSAGSASLKKLALGMVVTFTLVASMIFGGAYMANEYAKDFHVKESQLTGLDGGLIQVASAERVGDLFALPNYSVKTLAQLKEISCFVDMTSVPEVQGWTEGSFKVTSAFKKIGSSVAFFTTADGNTIKIDASSMVATMTFNGQTLPVADAAPANVPGRALMEDVAEPVLKNRRKLGRRGSGPDSGGSFAVSGSTSNRCGND
jgi:hypothetical protein